MSAQIPTTGAFFTWRDAKRLAATINATPGWRVEQIDRHRGGPTEGTESFWYFLVARYEPAGRAFYIYRDFDWPRAQYVMATPEGWRDDGWRRV